jgi:hypothetical protein
MDPARELGIGVLILVDELQEADAAELAAINTGLHHLGQGEVPLPLMLVGAVERHNVPGGCGASFRRGRFEFEVGLHQLGGEQVTVGAITVTAQAHSSPKRHDEPQSSGDF